KDIRSSCEARLASNDKRVYKKLFREIIKFDVYERLSEIKCPVLLVSGTQDRLVPTVHAQKMLEKLPQASLELIEHGGHVLVIDSPNEFNALLERFLPNKTEELVE